MASGFNKIKTIQVAACLVAVDEEEFWPVWAKTEKPQSVEAPCGESVIETTNRGSLLISVNNCNAHSLGAAAVTQGISSPKKKNGEQLRPKNYETLHETEVL